VIYGVKPTVGSSLPIDGIHLQFSSPPDLLTVFISSFYLLRKYHLVF